MTEQQFIVFKLNKETYAANIKYIGGITEYTSITKVPNSPAFVEGLINLRGEIIPVINLKKHFHLKEKEVDSDTRIMLYQIKGKEVGFIVDEASQVVKIDDENIDETPQLISKIKGDFLDGIGKVDGEIIMLLNLAKVLTENEKKDVITIGL